MNNFIFCSISCIPLRKRYLVFQRHILTAFFRIAFIIAYQPQKLQPLRTK